MKMKPQEVYESTMEKLAKHEKYILRKYREGMKIHKIPQVLWNDFRVPSEPFMVGMYLETECDVDIGNAGRSYKIGKRNWFRDMEQLEPFRDEIEKSFFTGESALSEIATKIRREVDISETSFLRYMKYLRTELGQGAGGRKKRKSNVSFF